MGARVLGPNEGKAGLLGSIGVRFMLAGEETGGGVVPEGVPLASWLEDQILRLCVNRPTVRQAIFGSSIRSGWMDGR